MNIFKWNINIYVILAIAKETIRLVITTGETWSMFASIDEDENLHQEHWNKMMEDWRIRMIMHNMSNIYPLISLAEGYN